MTDHFHSIEKGCEIESRIKLTRLEKGKRKPFDTKYCKTHNVDICRCGFEWGYHFNTHIERYTTEVYGNKLLYQR